jgi:integrase
MASRPRFDERRGQWVIKYRPVPGGEWKIPGLGKHPGWVRGQRVPKTPPQPVKDRAAAFAEVEYRAAHGLAPAPARAKGLEAFVEDYLELYRASRRPGSVKQMERHARDFLAFAAESGVTTLQGVTRPVCRDFLERRFRAGVSHDTLRTAKGYLVGIWTRAIDDGLVAANPWAGVKPPGKPAEPEITFWSPADIARIAAACGKPWQRDFVRVLGGTGLRISTALAMEWAWIDWAHDRITIPEGAEIKTAYVHVIAEDIRPVLERRQLEAGKSTLVFANPLRGGVVPTDSARQAIDRAIVKAGVKRGTPHDLRHSYARNLVLAGVPITVVQRQLGHSTLAMTMRYSTADEQSVRAALAKVTRTDDATPPSR